MESKTVRVVKAESRRVVSGWGGEWGDTGQAYKVLSCRMNEFWDLMCSAVMTVDCTDLCA